MTLLVQSSSNDGSASAFCTAIIKMTLNSKSLGSIGQGTYLLASPQLGSSSTNISAMFRNHYNFGTQEYSTVKMKDPTYYNILYSNTDRFGISASSLSGIITRGGVARDALFISYNTGLADQAAADTMTNYIQQGGVVVLLSSQVLSTDRPSYLTDAKSVITLGTGNLALMQNLFGPQVTPVLSTFNPRDVWKLPMAANNDKIFNGPFGDIRNQYIQAGATVYSTTGSSTSNYGVVGVSYDGIPINKLDWVINATNYNADNVAISSNIVGFKASGYNFIWFADPSLFTYIRYNTGELDAANTCGLEVIGYKPVDLAPNSGGNSSKFTTVNSKFLANLLAWAMEQAEYNGINSK